jgi:glycosyltransferase involved in cell wall biosynthesis
LSAGFRFTGTGFFGSKHTLSLPKLSIVTPSFRASSWLKLCVASVADQAGVEVEHIVQDAGSDDGTLDWLPQDSRVRAFVEKDAGMYDAVNRGFRRASGDVLAYLNCDEQYLPGALAAVAQHMATNPQVDVLLADFVVVDAAGGYLCSRYSMAPRAPGFWVRFSVPTCAMFLRRRVVREMGLFFDPQWKALGDQFWIAEACARGVRFAELRHWTSAFTETGANLGLAPVADRERAERDRRMPAWVRVAAPVFRGLHGWGLWRRGMYAQPPFRYSLFTHTSPLARVEFAVTTPSGRWLRPATQPRT